MALQMYHNGEFDEAHALIDLMLLADSTASVETSLKALKTRWSWGSERRVRHFLESVSTLGIASVEITPNKGTRIRINTEFSVNKKTTKNSKTTSVSTSVSTFEESYKEDSRPKASAYQPSSVSKNKNIVFDDSDLGDEYV